MVEINKATFSLVPKVKGSLISCGQVSRAHQYMNIVCLNAPFDNISNYVTMNTVTK